MSDRPPEEGPASHWRREAGEELRAAEVVAAHAQVPDRVAGFHAHLAAERAIKSLLIERGIEVPRIHDLIGLHRLLPATDQGRFAAADLEALTRGRSKGATRRTSLGRRLGPRRDTFRREACARRSSGQRWLNGRQRVADSYDVAVDFMDMTNELRLWVRLADVRLGFQASVGSHAVVGDEDAETRVARIVAIDPMATSNCGS